MKRMEDNKVAVATGDTEESVEGKLVSLDPPQVTDVG